MKYLTFNGHIVVPDDFSLADEESPIAEWVNTYLFDAEGLCNFDEGNGCTPEHWAAVHILTEEQFMARFDKD